MRRSKSSISKASSYEEIGAFWDTHDLTDYREQTRPVEFEVDLQSETTYFVLESNLSSRIRRLAAQRGGAPETLLNLWVQRSCETSSRRGN